MRRREVLLGLLGACVAWPVQLRTASAPSRSRMLAACAPEPSRPAVASGQPNAVDDAQSSHNTRDSPSATRAGQLLDALDFWLRRETIESVLPRAQAKALLTDLRDDRRFWAQQRKQFARWRLETHPVNGLEMSEADAQAGGHQPFLFSPVLPGQFRKLLLAGPPVRPQHKQILEPGLGRRQVGSLGQ